MKLTKQGFFKTHWKKLALAYFMMAYLHANMLFVGFFTHACDEDFMVRGREHLVIVYLTAVTGNLIWPVAYMNDWNEPACREIE